MVTPSERPFARYRLFETESVDEARSKVADIFCPHRLTLEKGLRRLDAWQNFTQLKSLGVGTMSYGADVVIEPEPLDTFYLLMLPYRGQSEVRGGAEAVRSSPGAAAILNPTDAIRMGWSRGCAKYMVRIDRERLARRLDTLLGYAPRLGVRFRVGMPLEGRAAVWWRYARLLMEELEREPVAQATVEELESLLLTSLIETQVHNHSDALASRCCRIAPRHVRLVEQYIEAHADQPVMLEDLVAVGGVSGRALYDGFRRFRDASPMAFLRKVRMRRAREELLDPSGGATVASVAARWGFFEFGRFAARYRSLFGESPSETLHRR